MRGISIFLVISLLIGSKVSSQISIFVENTYQHEIHAGSLSGGKAIINQKTYDIKGLKLLFEKDFDYETAFQKNITAYFYDSLDRMISKEIWTVDRKPVQLYRISYTGDNDTSVIEMFIPKDDTIVIMGIKRYFYDDQNRLKVIKHFDTLDKLLESQVFNYK